MRKFSYHAVAGKKNPQEGHPCGAELVATKRGAHLLLFLGF